MGLQLWRKDKLDTLAIWLELRQVEDGPTPHRRAFGTADSNEWTTTNPANTAALTTDDFRNRTNLADKTNAIYPKCEAHNVFQ
ncbi:hypothetical protein MRX96_007196 [Rhipicephalus microplus]